MPILYSLTYPTGGKLLVFGTGKSKYIPSESYTEMRRKLSETQTARKKAQSTEKSACELIDRIYAAKNIHFQEAETVGKTRFLIIKKKDRYSESQPAHKGVLVDLSRTRTGSFLRLATSRA